MIQNMQGFDQDVIGNTIACKDEVKLVTWFMCTYGVEPPKVKRG